GRHGVTPAAADGGVRPGGSLVPAAEVCSRASYTKWTNSRMIPVARSNGGPTVHMSVQQQTPQQAGADLEALSDLCTPWCIRVAATLRIADHIATGITDIEQLASVAGCDAGALHNVLGHLVGKGVFDETAPGRFALNAAARGLLGPPIHLDLQGIGGRFAHAWGTLLTYVRTGAPGYSEVFGVPF